MQSKLYISLATPDDLDVAMAFYADHGWGGMSGPDQESWQRILGRCVVPVIRQTDENGPIVAMCYGRKRERLKDEKPVHYPKYLLAFGGALRTESTKADPELKDLKFSKLMGAVRFAELIARGDVTVKLITETNRSTPFWRQINERLSGPKLKLSAFPGAYDSEDNQAWHRTLREIGYVPIRTENEHGDEWTSERQQKFMERTGIRTATEYMMSPHGLMNLLQYMVDKTTGNPPEIRLDKKMQMAQPAGREKVLSALNYLKANLAQVPPMAPKGPQFP